MLFFNERCYRAGIKQRLLKTTPNFLPCNIHIHPLKSKVITVAQKGSRGSKRAHRCSRKLPELSLFQRKNDPHDIFGVQKKGLTGFQNKAHWSWKGSLKDV